MYSLAWSVAALVAPLMSGQVIDRFGAKWLWGTCAVLGMVAGLGYALLMRGLSDRGRETEGRTADGPVVASAAGDTAPEPTSAM